MSKSNLVGKVYDDLIVIKDSGKRSSDRSIYWECKCICGNTCLRTKAVLESPRVHNCGCRKWKGYENLVGQKFNLLTVLEYDEEKSKLNKQRYWRCQCECGNIISVITANLKNNNSKSCGCLAKKNRIKEMIGRRYGKLTVFNIDEEVSKNNEYYWKCKCDCGKEITVKTHNLTMGYTNSCGCGHLSQGEAIIFTILKQNNINFNYDTTYFKDLIIGKSNSKKSLGRYDFIIFNENNTPIRLIEYDGEGHYENFHFYNRHTTLEDIKKYDKIKNEYAKQHNLPLVRIPYWEKKNITLEMLMGDKYLIN